MLSNFKDAFVNKPQFNLNPPKLINDYLNEGLPKNFSYIYNPDIELYHLDLAEGFSLSAGEIDLPQGIEMKEFIKNGKIDIKLLEQYSYNSQEIIRIHPDSESFFTINGEKIKANDVLKNPLKGEHFENVLITMKPPEFPPPVDVKISGNGHELYLKIQRKPVNSINTILFENVDDSIFNFSYKLDTSAENPKFTFNISKNINNNTRVEDIIKFNYIFNACIEGNALFNDIRIKNIKTYDVYKIPEKTIEFWNKVYEIEKKFNVIFKPNNDITIANMKKIYELYESLIQGNPFKRFKEFTHFKGDFDFTDNSMIDELIGSELSLIFNGNHELNIYGQTLKYYSLMLLNKAIVSDIYFDDKSEEYFIMIKNSTDEKMFVYQMDFLTKDDLDAFRNREDYVSILEKAEEIDYIEGQI